MGLIERLTSDDDDSDEQEYEQVGTNLTIGTLCDMLSAGRRRYIIEYLDMQEGDTVDYNDVVDHALELECGPDWGATERKRIYVALYQSHLPRLDETNIVDYNKDRGIIEKGPEFDAAAHVLYVLDRTLD